MKTPTLLVLMLLATVLAGCSDEAPPERPTSAECIEQGLILNVSAPDGPACEEPPFDVRGFEDPEHHCVVTKQRDRVHAPDLMGDPWVQGQYWEYSLAVDGEDLGATRLVYYDDQDFSGDIPLHYMVGTPTREEALRHALFAENPMIGRVHRILYSPHESGDHADMFHFPLCSGSTWTTKFYGETFTLTASEADVAVPGQGAPPGFRIQGTSREGGTLGLSYSPTAQWFTYIDLERADGGSVKMDLVALGDDATGEAFFLRGQKDEAVDLGEGVTLVRETSVVREEGAEGPYDTIGMYVQAEAVSGTYQVALVDPSGTARWSANLGELGDAPSIEALVEVPFVAGEWTVREFLTPLGEASGAMRLVSIYDRSATV